MGKIRDRAREAKPVNPLFYIFASIFIRPRLLRLFNLQPLNKVVVPFLNGPAILVANHVNFFDPIWIYIVLDRPMHFVATEELFQGRIVSFLVRLFGTIPFRRAARDFQSIRLIIELLRAGGVDRYLSRRGPQLGRHQLSRYSENRPHHSAGEGTGFLLPARRRISSLSPLGR
jgi:1-acyl-sn-glycerol-3-phosphate acyltransferase